jgi:hypothetical protein
MFSSISDSIVEISEVNFIALDGWQIGRRLQLRHAVDAVARCLMAMLSIDQFVSRNDYQ